MFFHKKQPKPESAPPGKKVPSEERYDKSIPRNRGNGKDTRIQVNGILKEKFNKDGNRVVYLSGDINKQTAYEIEEKVKEELTKDEKVLIFDLTDVNYLCSHGLQMFINLQNYCNQLFMKFYSINLSDDIYTLFKITGYSSVLTLFSLESSNYENSNYETNE